LVIIVTSEGGSSNLVMQSIKAQRVHAAHYVLCYTAALPSDKVTRYVLYRPPPKDVVVLLPAGCVDDDEKDVVVTRVTKVPVPEQTPPLLQVKAALPIVESILRSNLSLWVLISVDASVWSPARMEMYQSVLSQETKTKTLKEVSGFRPTTRGYFDDTLPAGNKIQKVELKDAADPRLFDLLAVRPWVFLSFLRNKSDEYLAHRYSPLGYVAHVYTWSIKKQHCLPQVITFNPIRDRGGVQAAADRVTYASVPQAWEAPPVAGVDARDLVDRALFTTRMDDLMAAVKDKSANERNALQDHLHVLLNSMDVDDVDSVVENALWAALE
jgi:hypothetical protein